MIWFSFFIVFFLLLSPLNAQEFILEKYMGKWFEIARLPNSFQKKCARDVSAYYTLRENGDVSVLNQCIDHTGVLTSARGVGWRPNLQKPYELKVSFVPLVRHFHFFGGEYHILALSPTYEWSIVVAPRAGYLWILARQPAIDRALRASLLQKVSDLGYQRERLIFTKQAEIEGCY